MRFLNFAVSLPGFENVSTASVSTKEIPLTLKANEKGVINEKIELADVLKKTRYENYEIQLIESYEYDYKVNVECNYIADNIVEFSLTDEFTGVLL